MVDGGSVVYSRAGQPHPSYPPAIKLLLLTVAVLAVTFTFNWVFSDHLGDVESGDALLRCVCERS